MTNDVAEKTSTGQGKTQLSTIQLKRQITIKSLVNETFREKARTELSDELRLIEAQLEQLENQYQATLKQIESMAKAGQNISKQLDQVNREAQEKRSQLANIKMQVASNLANLDRVQNGDMVVTGVLESYADINIGDNIYEKLRGAEIILENGLVTKILG